MFQLQKAWLVAITAISLCLAWGCNGQSSSRAFANADEPPVVPPPDLCPLLIGATVPSVPVRTSAGQTVDLRALLAERGSGIVVFYRGGWCRYCMLQLTEIAGVYPVLARMGFQVIAISPDSPEQAAEVQREHALPFDLFSDADLLAARAFRVAHWIDEATVARYRAEGVRLPPETEGGGLVVPMASVFLLDRGGMIRFAHINPDYRLLLDRRVLLTAAQVMLEDTYQPEAETQPSQPVSDN